MTIAVLDPLVLRVARRYLSNVRTTDRAARAETVAREYQRRGEGLAPVGEEEEEDGDKPSSGPNGPSRRSLSIAATDV